MKSITKILCVAMLSLSLTVSGATVVSKSAVSSGINKTETATEAGRLLNRLEEIRKMDKTNLGVAEKAVLRKEVLSIKDKLSGPNGLDGGIYISAGALLVIIILLIILL